MAIYTSDNRTKKMTPKEIKQEIKQLNNLSETEYRKQRDVLRLRLRNYEKTIGAKTAQDTSEVWLRISRRQAAGYPLLPEQQQIINFTAQSTGAFGRAYEARGGRATPAVESAVSESLTGSQFNGLLEKSPTAKAAYDTWFNENTKTNKDGVVIETPSAREINKKLGELAKDLHNKQEEWRNSHPGAGKRNAPTT